MTYGATTDRRPILNYHGIGVPSSERIRQWTVSIDNFVEQLDYLESHGWHGVSMAQALSDPHPSHVVLTFDDGFSDFSSVVAPLLLERNFRATVYVVAADLGSAPNWLPDSAGSIVSRHELRRLRDAGFEVGSHSLTHPQLDLLSIEDARHEIAESKRLLEEELGERVEGFCYPHGFFNASVREAVAGAGYSYACAVRHKLSGPGDDIFALARIVINNDTTTAQLDRWIRGFGLRQGGLFVERALASVFRTYRRNQLRASGQLATSETRS